MSGMNWERANARDRSRRRTWSPTVRPSRIKVRDDYVDPGERKQVLAIAAAYAERNKFCRDLIEKCGTGIGRGVTRKQADLVYRISREQTAATPRTRGNGTGYSGANDYQRTRDLYN